MTMPISKRWLAGFVTVLLFTDGIHADETKVTTPIRLEGPRAAVVAFSPRGQWVCTGSADGSVRLHATEKEGPVAAAGIVLKCQGPLQALQVSADESWLLTLTTDGAARLFSLSTRGK
jgi:hypothetical protein